MTEILDLSPYEFIKAGDDLIPVGRIRRIRMRDQEGEDILISTDDGFFVATGQDAWTIIMTAKPSALEGRRRKWRKGSWAFHNLVGHPVMQILAWIGMSRAAIRFHDRTVPR